MATFTAYSDESGDGQGFSYRSGFIAPENDWNDTFSPAWRTTVLRSEPRIDEFHMTDLLNPEWQREQGLSRGAVEAKLDAAFDVIAGASMLTPICLRIHGGHFREAT